MMDQIGLDTIQKLTLHWAARRFGFRPIFKGYRSLASAPREPILPFRREVTEVRVGNAAKAFPTRWSVWGAVAASSAGDRFSVRRALA